MNLFLGITLIALFLVLAILSNRKKWIKGLGFTFMVFVFAIGALTFPSFFISWGNLKLESTIAPLVQIILFGMGMTLNFDDFKRVLKIPKAVMIGLISQYTIMPIFGFFCASLFGLSDEIAVGLILIGSCPGGATSNVIAYLARANVPLSITMTACSTMVSPIMTPLAMWLLADTFMPVQFLPMMISIIKMIIIPLILGILIHRFLPRLAKISIKVLPLIAMLSICLIIAITLAISRDDLMHMGFTLFAAAAFHNAFGYLLGYNIARIFKMNSTDCRTVALEVGVQNGGMATGLAFNVLNSAKAALASAIFGPWSAITSSVLASLWRKSSKSHQILKIN